MRRHSGKGRDVMKQFSIRNENSGAAAVEFALIAPFFLILLLTMIAYGIYLATSHALQQVAADAARTAIAGLDERERQQLAREYVLNSTLDYPLMDPREVQINVVSDPKNAEQFTVVLTYNAEALPIWGLYTYMLPGKTITKFSTIRLGGL